MKRVAIFIDGNNFYFSLKKLYGKNKNLITFNFEKLCKFLANKREIVGIFYYNAPLNITKNLEKYKSQQRFFEKIKKIFALFISFNMILTLFQSLANLV